MPLVLRGVLLKEKDLMGGLGFLILARPMFFMQPIGLFLVADMNHFRGAFFFQKVCAVLCYDTHTHTHDVEFLLCILQFEGRSLAGNLSRVILPSFFPGENWHF